MALQSPQPLLRGRSFENSATLRQHTLSRRDAGSNRESGHLSITQVSLESDGFDFQVWHQETSDVSFERADLAALYSAYKEEAASFLEKIVAGLAVAPDY
jgi:hypothetical protein